MINKIWLSGSRGFVGKVVRKKLFSQSIPVTYISNRGSKGVKGIDFSDKKSIESALLEFGTPNTFIHLGWANVYEPHDERHIDENLKNGKNLIDTLYEYGVEKIIHIGSSSEYGDRVGCLKEENIEPTGKVNNYIKGKLALAKYGLRKAEHYGKIFNHIRLSYTYGAGQTHNSLINQLYMSALSKKKMRLSPCLQFRDYIYVEDAADGIIKTTELKKSGIVNLGSGKAIQLKDFVKIFWKRLGCLEKDLHFGFFEQPGDEQSQPIAFLDLSVLRLNTSWEPKFKIEDGIKMTIEQLIQEKLN
ncbi:MAG: hypothetical protein CBC25_04350 [Pelagibacteraceae bacterium TMED65]|nr:MAG: hypothetical protein CBC25_04350 [Pelagibacteraceae bacterium TMED65]|tara:strand:- start:7843 stop:8748 length:906 start_codon:yes stop_codon:yes gene_type:complete